MTRENKAGLVVCGSFLCLVAAVVAVKLRQPPASDAPPVVSPTLALSGVASPEKGKPETLPEPPSHPPGKEPPAAPPEPAAAPVMPPAPPGPSVEPPAAPLPSGPPVDDPNHKEPPAAPPAPGPSAPLPPVDPPAKDPPPLPPLPGHDSDPPMTPPVEPPPLPAPPPVDPPAPTEGMHEKKNGPDDEASGHGPKKPKHPGEGGENVVAVPPDPPAAPMNPAADKAPPMKEPNPTKKGDNAVEVPAVPGPAADPDAPPKLSGPAAQEPPPLPGSPEPPVPAPKVVEPPPLPSGVKIEPPSPAIVAPAAVKPIKIKPDAPADPPVKPGNVGVIPPDPPAPAPPVAVAPTRPQAAAPSGPLVDSWDEQTYVCRPGDDFASICKANYPKDGYAKALELYNRNHPRASDAMRTSGALAPGEKVYIPPMNILEKRHGDAIASQKPASVGAAAPVGAGAVQADFRTVAPAAPTYTVKAPGERLYQIAARVLGDGQRWNEIGKLNPAVNPENVVPAGTVLTLPAATNAPPGGGR